MGPEAAMNTDHGSKSIHLIMRIGEKVIILNGTTLAL